MKLTYLMPWTGAILALFALTSTARADGLVSYWPGNHNFRDVVSGNDGKPVGNVAFGLGRYHSGFVFHGSPDSIVIPDNDSLKFTRSMTISAWLDVESPDFSPIFFRGDSRDGIDPYHLFVTNDTLAFEVTSDTESASLSAPIAQGRFVYVAATLDDQSGTLRLYEDGQVVAETHTDVRPFRDLDPDRSPGVSIGNFEEPSHQNGFIGTIDEVRAYDISRPMPRPISVTPADAIVQGGSQVVLDAHFGEAPIQDLVVNVISTNASAVPPPTMRLKYGTTDRLFTVTTTPVSKQEKAIIRVTANGMTASTTVIVRP